MSDTIIFLQLEHGTIARVLDLIEAQAQRWEREGKADLPLVRLALDYFVEYPDACHHPKEDAVFRRLRKKDPEAAAAIGDLLGDHDELRRFTEKTVEEIREPRTDGRSPADVLHGFVREYRRHLFEEEQRFLPVAAQKLDREDWDLIDFEVFERDDPLYDAKVENRFSELRRILWMAAEIGD